MKIEVGKTYITASGEKAGTMVNQHHENLFVEEKENLISPVWRVRQSWNGDGTVCHAMPEDIPHTLVSEYVAPLVVEIGKKYVTKDGHIVGPMIANKNIKTWLTCESTTVTQMNSNKYPQAWEKNGKVAWMREGEEGHEIVAEYVETVANLKISAGVTYVTRDGRKVTLSECEGRSFDFAGHVERDEKQGKRVYQRDGKHGSQFIPNVPGLDIVAEYDPSADKRGVTPRADAVLSGLSTDAEPVKTPFEIASKHIPEARVSLLSRAIRQGLNDYGWKNFGTLPEVLMGYIVEAERAEAAAHADPVKTAPAVAVTALVDACQSMADDYQTSDNHHPDHVLVPLSAFEAMRAVLSMDSGSASMDDEDRTPMPAGFDDAMWRKADEVHHAMALVARDQECVKIIYAALSTHNVEPRKTAPAVASGLEEVKRLNAVIEGLTGKLQRVQNIHAHTIKTVRKARAQVKKVNAALSEEQRKNGALRNRLAEVARAVGEASEYVAKVSKPVAGIDVSKVNILERESIKDAIKGVHSALGRAFEWDSTTHGHSYWAVRYSGSEKLVSADYKFLKALLDR